ncbi:MAG: NAD(+) diphosphatase, partial [Nocardioidaceae bacterium]
RALVDDEDGLVFSTPQEAPEGERYLLGLDEGGTAYFGVAAPLPAPPPRGRAASLRSVGAFLPDRDAGLLVHAVALQHWHATHTHCPRCGAPTDIAAAGHVRRCPRDGSEHFPRVDPAVIALVHDGAGCCVLAHQPRWPDRRFSVIAGFVEPGESLERAVAREVGEEVDLAVREARYVASQPWPFPASLMLGFEAVARHDPIHVDDDEISDAHWYTRTELVDAVERGAVLLPARVSIARQLIERWYGGELPDPQV